MLPLPIIQEFWQCFWSVKVFFGGVLANEIQQRKVNFLKSFGKQSLSVI